MTGTRKQLEKLILYGEGFNLEFKTSLSRDFGKELCAFANSVGGKIIVGVDDTGRIVGLKNLNRLKSEIQSVARNIDPPLAVDIETVENVLIVNVPKQHSKPYSVNGRFYMREGTNSQQMKRDEIREFFFKEGLIHFDEMVNKKFDLKKHLHTEKLTEFRKKAFLPEELSQKHILDNLSLLKDGKMTNTGAWLFAEDVRKFNLSATITCALFQGTTKTKILDRKEFYSDIYSNYQSAMN